MANIPQETAPWDTPATSATAETAPWESAAPDDSIGEAMISGQDAENQAGAQVSGALPNMLSGGVAGPVAKLAGRVVDALPPSTTLGTGADWNSSIPNKADKWGAAGAGVLAPAAGTPGAQFEQGVGGVAHAVAQKLPGINTNIGQTLYGAGGEALNDAALLAGPLGTAAKMGRAFEGMDTFDSASVYSHPDELQPAEAPPKIAPGPVTADQLRQGSDRLPPPPPRAPATAAPPDAALGTEPAATGAAPRTPVPGKPHIRLKVTPTAPEPAGAPEPTPELAAAAAPEPAPLSAPQTDEGEISTGTPPGQPEQQARLGAVQQLQADTGAVMPNIRKSAVTGDFRETGTDYQLGELGDPDMKLQLDQEQNALKAASKQQIQNTGGVADGVEKPALLQRGQIIDRALQGVGNWFDQNIRGLYKSADASANGRPFSLQPNPQTGTGSFSALMGDHSQFTGIEGKQLHQDVQQVAQQFGLTGQGGFWSPTTVQNAERFRQWLGEQYTPRTGRVIGRLKDALDSDVAAHGGGGLYDSARALRFRRDQMLAGAKGIEKMLPEKRPDGKIISRPVPLEDTADHITNLPTDEFNHVVNVLHDSSKLGNGELADANAAAINEIRRHMAERLHAAGTKQRDGFWDPHAYHDTLNNYSTKLPSVFSPEGIRRFQTIHDAGNALRVNKRYGGAAKQIMQAGGLGAEARKRFASAAEDLTLGWLGPAKGLIAGATGLSGKVRDAIERRLPGGNVEARTAARVAERVQPLGQRIAGGKQGGWIGDLQKSKLPAVEHSYDPETREHVVRSANGETRAQQRGNNIQITETNTAPEAAGKGEGVARVARLADEAHAQGGILQSDTSVSKSGQKVYPALAHLGYQIAKNSEAREAVDDIGQRALRSENGRPVFTVGPRRIRPPLRQGYDPAAAVLDQQVQRDVEAAHANPNGARPPLRQGDDAAAPIYDAQARQDASRPLAAKFPGQRGGPKYQASKTLENFVRAKAPPHRVDENGPSNWEELQARGHEPVLPVNPHGAEGSIYSNVPTNIAFRALHDATHLALNAGFDHDGELRVAMEHQRQARAAGLSPEDRKALWADTWETFKHHQQTGEFPKDPREFVGGKMDEYAGGSQGPQNLASKFPGQRGGPKVERQTETMKGGGEKVADSPMSTLNIGLHIGDPANGGHVLDLERAKGVIDALGYRLGKTSVVHSNTEPTLVADIHGTPVSPDDLHSMSEFLDQGAIAQRLPNGSGMLEGPKAKEWGPYNPDYFRMHNGKTATEDSIHPNSTVTNPQRSAFPGIYDKPSDILSRVKTTPEDPILKQLFGVTRKDLHDTAVGRTSNMPYDIPGAAAKPKGSKAAGGVMNDKNAQRLVDTINEAKKNPELYHGMAGWYVMDPLYKKVAETVGAKAAPAIYSRLNAFMGMASPGSDVESEINRGTAANMMATQGKFDKFLQHGGRPEGSRGKPKELAAVRGHPYHSTAQGGPMAKYLESGSLQMGSPKVPTYVHASGVPETGFQNHLLVGDSHWSRGVGLADTRTRKDFADSVKTAEIQQLHPWYRDHVAKATGLPPTSAQAVQWGALSHETGVDTPVGAPKLELFAQQVRKAAARLKVTPEEALKRIILGTAHAG